MSAERRTNQRWDIESLEVAHLTALDHFQLIATRGHLIDASIHGILLHIDREDLVAKQYRSNLTMDPLIGEKISVEIRQMNLDIIGRVVRTRPLGKGKFEIAIDYTEDAPDYWRECLVDLLPKTGIDEF